MLHLEGIGTRPGIDPEFCRYQTTLLKGEIERLEAEVDQMQDEYPNLRDYALEQLREELLTVEATTYAELVQTGRLNHELSPFLQLEAETAPAASAQPG